MANRTSSLRALGIGFVAGLRSMTAPAAVSWAASSGRLQLGNSPLSLLDTNLARRTTRKLAIGELIGDKTSLAPRRLQVSSLTWRLISGGVCGAALSVSDSEDPRTGAALGAMGALVGSLLGYAWRTHMRTRRNTSDLPLAMLEDVVAVGSAIALVSCAGGATREVSADLDNPAWVP